MNPAQDAKGIQENAEPATIPEAYSELTQEAFAIWMRLLCCTNTQLEQGRKAISSVLGYSEGRSNVILRELKHKGYITFHRAERPGLPTAINIRRKAIISGPARIIRLGRDGSGSFGGNSDQGDTVLRSAMLHFPQSPELPDFEKSLGNCQSDPRPHGVTGLNFSIQKPTSLFSQNLENAPKPGTDSAGEIPKKKKRKKQKFVGLGGGYVREQASGLKTDSQAAKPQPILDIQKLRDKGKNEKSRRKAIEHTAEKRRQTAIGQTAEQAKAAKVKRKQLLAEKDLRGKPQLKFDCSAEKRKGYIALLDRKSQSPLKKQFLEKIETEAARIYTRYRREFDNLYVMHPREKVYMREFGELCIRKGVTPAQVMAYWRVKIKTFADRKLDIVPPQFLKSPANIDTAAIAVMSATKGGKKKWRPESFVEERTPVHSYADTSRLHPKLRKGLESAGFDVSEYSDRYLMSVQSPAKDLAAGRTPFISSKIRPMAEWAARHIFKKMKGDKE